MPTSRTRRTFRLRGTAAAIALGFALVSCDSGGSDDGASEPSGDGAADTANESENGADDNPQEAEGTSGGTDSQDSGATGTGSGDTQGNDAQDSGGHGWDGSSAPAFLEAEEVPSAYGDTWTNQQTAQGVPDREGQFCLNGLVPAESSWFRHYAMDLMGDAYQVNISTADPQAAADLLAELNTAAANCAEEQDNERGSTEFQDHGEVDAGDEAHAYSMVWTPNDPAGIYGAAIGIARSGSTVTYLYLVEGADLGDFPSGTFDEPLSTALSRAGG